MGQFTPNIGIYIASAGETNYADSSASGMINIDQHDHSGGPNKGVAITSSGLADFAVTYKKLNSNVVNPDTGIGVDSSNKNQLIMLGILRNIFEVSQAIGSDVGFMAMNGGVVNNRTFQDTSSIIWSNPNGSAGNPSASVGLVTADHGGTGLTSLTANAILTGGATPTGNFQQIPTGNPGEVLTSNGAGTPATFQPLGGLGQIQYVSFNLSTAQVLAINATSVQVLPAQGAGKVIVPIFSYGLLNSSGTAFTLASQTTSIGYFYNDTDLVMNFANSAFRSTADTYWWSTQATSGTGSVKANAQNTPLYIGMAGPLIPYLAGGTSTISFVLAYTVITL